jgi:pyrroloquinoline quinone biosynthesis protein B
VAEKYWMMEMNSTGKARVSVLGAAAGGGLPQWNCGCSNCVAARIGSIPSQTQSSIAITGDGDSWVILNASPDIRLQLTSTEALSPSKLRDSPIVSVVLTNGDVDHLCGLLTLREKQAFKLIATPSLLETVRDNQIFNVLDPEFVTYESATLNAPFSPSPGVTMVMFTVPGKVPLYAEVGEPEIGGESENTVGLEFYVKGHRCYYIPGCAMMTNELKERIRFADLVLFDGTVFQDDELIKAGVSLKSGRRMGHTPISGPDGSLGSLVELGIGRVVYIHINNTNPIWQHGAERRSIEGKGLEIGFDGMEIVLDTK